MFPRSGVLCLLLLFPALSRAQQEPEDLLPVGTQVYLRWDGIDAHRTAYSQTALGKMLQGDTGRFLANVLTQLQDLSGSLLTVEQLFQGVPPERLQRIRADAAEVPKLLPLLAQHGLVIGVEMRSLDPPAVQGMLIVPDAGVQPAPLFGTLHLVAGLLKLDVKETKIAGRRIHHLEAGPVQLAWWTEGKHAVVSAGTDHPQTVLKRIQGSDPRLSTNPLFKKVHTFNQFETGARAFVDVAALTKLAQSRGKEMAKLMSDLGLDQVQSWTMYSGFDGEAERSVSELTMSGSRKGILRLVSGKPFKLTDLPPVPPDAVAWSATNFDAGVFYDTGVQAVESIVAALSPDDVPKVKGFLQIADGALGISLRNDLLGALGEQFMQYTSPAEGPFSFGQTFLFKVKNANKLQGSFEQAVKALAKLIGVDATLKKTTYRGVTLHELQVRQPGFFFVPTFAIHNDWLVIGYFPQAVQGYVLRATGELPRWQPDRRVQAALDRLPKEFISITVTDPRPGMKQLLALAPLAGSALKSLVPDARFEVGMIPNGHEATQHLFPNVSVVSDEGTTLRSETRASLQLPIEQLTGLDTYALFLIGFGVFGRIF
jgi:hypothetical protein